MSTNSEYVVNPRAALLSNYEVLSLLRELESDHLARTKTAIRIKKEEETLGLNSNFPAGGGKDPTVVEVSENLRTVSFEAIKYLSADYQPTASQTPEAIAQLIKSLEPYDLTKAEKLQIVNLAPQQHIELYVIVEELEDRLAERMEDVMSHVQESLVLDPAVVSAPLGQGLAVPKAENRDNGGDWEVDAEYAGDEYDDKGEGAGVDGDLDMEDN
ncbi:HRDC-like protein [Mycena metata]|uniref:DNA-directed RNA polymerase III subunit RPC9 n=1 Tax=Mycena metata TaxID=1033252 RepID=A0AAD7NWJ6_9AGAR|nr:HRDC-like protein [Mycena metata]